ncbi:hypothetical protein [Streptomyces mesophilus]|uniref:hypothetical protein n=1 Tax=Streptomyces mesophilus TaxID=1775132 RepID=UPI0033327F41
MSERQAVRELLERAVERVPVPVGRDAEAVFARAGRVRRRRRAAAVGVGAAVMATGIVLGAGVLPGRVSAEVAASPAGETGGAGGIEDLLPAGIGEVREVSLVRLIKGAPDAEPVEDVGPYDGDYAVERGGGAGYVSVRAYPPDPDLDPGDPCVYLQDKPKTSSRMADCVTERLPGGARLSIWRMTAAADEAGLQPRRGTELAARLELKDGTVLSVLNSTGWLGPGQLGPLLDSFPLTREQLRELVLKPQLLP